MIVRWKMDQENVRKLIVLPENDQESHILTMLLQNGISLKTHLLLATKEEPSKRIRTIQRNGEWIKQEHL